MTTAPLNTCICMYIYIYIYIYIYMIIPRPIPIPIKNKDMYIYIYIYIYMCLYVGMLAAGLHGGREAERRGAPFRGHPRLATRAMPVV